MILQKRVRIGNVIVTFFFCMLLIACLYPKGVFGYLDELIACFSLLSIVVLFIIGKFKVSSVSMILIILALVLVGLISNYLSNLNISVLNIAVDSLILLKPIVIFVASIQLASADYILILRQRLKVPLRIFLGVIVILFFLNLLGKIDMSDDTFGNLRNFKFIFDFSGAFGLFLYALIPLVDSDKKVSSKIWISLIFFLMLFTFKSQILFFLLIFLGIYLFEKASKQGVKFIHIISIVFIGMIILIPTIQNYFVTAEYSPRKLLLDDGVKLMKKYFPLGAGFSTFASPMSRTAYSPIYVEKGYYLLHGMGSGESSFFLSDNYSAAVIGQFGFLGIILFLIEGLVIIKYILYRKLLLQDKVFCLTAVLALVGTTLASSYYTSSTGALIMLIAGALIAGKERKEK